MMDTDHDLLFAVLAFRAELLDAGRFADACAAWSARRDASMADLLLQRGWITRDDRAALEDLLAVKLKRFAGDAHAALSDVDDDQIWRLLTSLADGGDTPSQDSEPIVSRPTQPNSAPAPSFGEKAQFLERSTRSGIPSTAPTVDMGAPHQEGSPEPAGHVLLSVVPFTPEPHERYTLTRLHARGGIGQVWLARDAALGREVALKELRPERARDPMLWARFLEEARITGQLEHPSIVPVYELARRADDQYPFYTMRFVRGRTLTEALRDYHNRRREGRAEPLELPTLLNSFVGVCHAVAFAHSRGVIHRDLKGQNVVLGDYGEVILLDWGLAKLIDHAEAPAPLVAPLPQGAEGREATEPGQALGTPAYMSPEQAAGRTQEVDRLSDVYGLGAILYEILTGQPPFTGPRTDELLRRVREEEPAEPRRVNPQAPVALEAVCRKAMSKARDARYSSATDVAREVQRFLADEPLSAYREPLAVRAGRWARRHRTLVAASAVLVLSAAVALAVGGVLVARERDDSRRQGRFARRAVDDMYTQVAEKWLGDQPRMDPLQKQFLEKALDYYERFAQTASSDPSVRREKGQAYHHMGDILRKLGRHDEAEKAYRRAIDLLDRLAREHPDQRQYRLELAHAQNRLGLVLRATGRFGTAETAYRRALAIEEPLAASRLAEPQYRHYLAKTHKNLGDLLESTGHHKDSESAYRRAVDLWEALAREAPGEAEYREDLAAGLLSLGRLLQGQDRRTEALDAYRRTSELLETLVAEAPSLPRRREFLAVVRMALGWYLITAGQVTEAEQAFQRSLALYSSLSNDFPDRPEYRSGVARGELNLGHVASTAGRPAAAEAAFRRAAKAFEALVAMDAPGATQNRIELARCHNNLGLLLAAAGRRLEAEAAYKAVLQIYRELAAAEPRIPQRRRELGGALGNFGLFLSGAGRSREAEAAYQEARNLFEKLAAEHPEVPDYRWALGWSHALLGSLGGPDAEVDHRQAVEIYEALVSEVPEVREYRVEFVQSSNNLGDYLKNKDRAGEAEPVLRKAIMAAAKLAQDFPDMADFAGLHGQVLATLGELKQKTGAPAEARSLLETAASELRRARTKLPDRPDLRAGLRDADLTLARVLVEVGRTAESDRVAGLIAQTEDLAEEIAHVVLDRSAGCVDSARVMALAASLAEERKQGDRARACFDRAIRRLHDAVAAGFKGVERLAADPEFAALSRGERFRTLIEPGP
jgi:tetratricopeptide (TPR) repeat protein/tRNA A-37 threonylcarbamoyl transferase component Bud32